MLSATPPPVPASLPERAFFALPALSSSVVLISAVCLIAGAWGLLAPSLADERSLAGRFAASGVLAAYLAALGGVIALLLRWQRANPDAIGPTLVGVVFSVGLAVAIDLLARPCRGIAAAMAVAGLGGTLWLGRAWIRASGIAAPPWALPAALLLAWNFLWPLAQSFGCPAVNGPQRIDDPFALWLAGLAPVLAALLWLAVRAARAPQPWAGSGPFLARPAMGWIVAALLAAATALHIYIAGYLGSVDFLVGDLLPPALAVTVLGLELAARRHPDGRWDAPVLALFGTVVVLLALLGQGVPGPGHAPYQRGGELTALLHRWLLSPGPVLALTALVAAGCAYRRGDDRTAIVGIGLLLAALLVWGTRAGDLRLPLAASGLGVALLGWAAWRRDPLLGVWAVVGTLAWLLPWSGTLAASAKTLGLHPALLLVQALGAVLLLSACCWPRLLPRPTLRSAAVLLGVALLPLGRDTALLPWLTALVPAVVVAAAAWRARDAFLPATLLPPAGALAWQIGREQLAWLAVFAAFALLVVALGVARWRLRRAGGER